MLRHRCPHRDASVDLQPNLLPLIRLDRKRLPRKPVASAKHETQDSHVSSRGGNPHPRAHDVLVDLEDAAQRQITRKLGSGSMCAQPAICPHRRGEAAPSQRDLRLFANRRMLGNLEHKDALPSATRRIDPETMGAML